MRARRLVSPPAAKLAEHLCAFGADAWRLTVDVAPDILAVLKDKGNWISMPQGQCLALPFQVACHQDATGGPAADADPQALRNTQWLGLSHTLSIVPFAQTIALARDGEGFSIRAAAPSWRVCMVRPVLKNLPRRKPREAGRRCRYGERASAVRRENALETGGRTRCRAWRGRSVAGMR